MDSDIYSSSQELGEILWVGKALKEKRWADASIGVLLWTLLFISLLMTVPGWIWDKLSIWFMKFRYWAADRIKPKHLQRNRENFGSDIVQKLIEYEVSASKGQDREIERINLIRSLKDLEQELNEHRTFWTEVHRLEEEKEKPKRKEAIKAQQARQKGPAEHE